MGVGMFSVHKEGSRVIRWMSDMLTSLVRCELGEMSSMRLTASMRSAGDEECIDYLVGY